MVELLHKPLEKKIVKHRLVAVFSKMNILLKISLSGHTKDIKRKDDNYVSNQGHEKQFR